MPGHKEHKLKTNTGKFRIWAKLPDGTEVLARKTATRQYATVAAYKKDAGEWVFGAMSVGNSPKGYGSFIVLQCRAEAIEVVRKVEKNGAASVDQTHWAIVKTSTGKHVIGFASRSSDKFAVVGITGEHSGHGEGVHQVTKTYTSEKTATVKAYAENGRGWYATAYLAPIVQIVTGSSWSADKAGYQEAQKRAQEICDGLNSGWGGR